MPHAPGPVWGAAGLAKSLPVQESPSPLLFHLSWYGLGVHIENVHFVYLRF